MHEQIGVGLVVSAAEHCFMLSKWESERADFFDEGFDRALCALKEMCNDRMVVGRGDPWDSGVGLSGYDQAMREVIKWADAVCRDPDLPNALSGPATPALTRTMNNLPEKQKPTDTCGCALAQAPSSAVRCPVGLDGSPHICSAGTCTICRFLADHRPMTPEERAATDEFFLSLFEPNAPAGAQPPH